MKTAQESIVLDTLLNMLMPIYDMINTGITKENRKYVLFGLGTILCISLISLIAYYYYLFFSIFVSIKVMLYLLTSYIVDENEEENSPQDIIEYSLILIFMNFIYPLTFLPYIWLFGYLSIVFIGIAGLASKNYRQQMILFVQKLLKSNENKKGEIQSILETLLQSIMNINRSVFNITHNTTKIYSKINLSDNLADGLAVLSEIDDSFDSDNINDNNNDNNNEEMNDNNEEMNNNDIFNDEF